MKRWLLFLALILTGCAQHLEIVDPKLKASQSPSLMREPAIFGVAEGRTYSAPVEIYIEEPNDVVTESKMDGAVYKNAERVYSVPGPHVLSVTYKSKLDGRQANRQIRFTLDFVLPIRSVLSGIEDGKFYRNSVTIAMTPQYNVAYTLWIDGKIYQPGTRFSGLGTHRVDVMAVHIQKNTSSSDTFSFTITP